MFIEYYKPTVKTSVDS